MKKTAASMRLMPCGATNLRITFELGAGSGWNAALISYLVGEKGHVYSTEIIPEVAELAKENIQKLKMKNVTIIEGDGDDGLTKDVLFDRVIFTAGSYDLPSSLFRQVKNNGLILFPLKVKGGGDILYLLRKQEDHFVSIHAIDCGFVTLAGRYHIKNMKSMGRSKYSQMDLSAGMPPPLPCFCFQRTVCLIASRRSPLIESDG